jgi:hypothetical protein
LRARRLIATALLLLSGASVLAADAWNLLGSTSVTTTPPGAKPQRDEVRLPSARGSFSSIRLAAGDAKVVLDHIVVTFAHGSTQRVDLHKTLDRGQTTSEIALKGSDHVIRKVEFWYNAPGFTTVSLYAR